tara:strand:- start:8103 stop:8474 length:372 start_codon:yes stop_codon:yes gene_type:complete
MVLETQVLPPPETSLRTTQPNVGNENVFYAHCPNCSKGYQIVDEKLQTLDPPSLCIRCGCPIEKHGDQALATVWMDEEAVKNHKSEIALVGERMRGTLGSVEAKWNDADALRERLAQLEADED